MSKLSKLSTKDLFAIALSVPLTKVEWRDLWDEKYKPHKRGIFKIYPWDAIDALEKRTTRKVYRKARKLCGSKKSNERLVGVYILSSFGGWDTPIYRKQRFRFLLKMIDKERNPRVLSALIAGLGHFYDKRANPAFLSLRRHEKALVRLSVAMELYDLDLEYEEIVDALIELSVDEDDFVRDWATMRLRNLEFDSEKIREALFARLSDSKAEARGEALAGLAKRKDQRAFDLLMEALEETPLSYLALEAAEALADARLLPTLYKLREESAGDGTGIDYSLQQAIAACEGKKVAD